MSTAGIQYINGRKTFIPLENNPDVLSTLSHNLGVSPKLTFHDVLSTTSADLLGLIPRPVNALIFLCDTPIYTATRSAVEPTIPAYQGSGPDEPVIWVKQTIGHACGLMAFLHCVWNLNNGDYILPDSELAKLRTELIALGPVARSEKLYNSVFLERAHMHAAAQGSSHVPSPADECGYHFVALVKDGDGRVWELNGGLNGPLLRGTLGPDQDLLSDQGLELTVREYLDAARGLEGNQGDGISLVALAGAA
ncbi:peptidase C12, ubiquitin carboxyl-terminal hydrolase 1 [Aspergillus terreus]|uniref:Ubiquitin carboxyl-terminal hydrolase n=1 Tax=Aspergillus terreus TaxID=33178 RepID=A0A5M3YUA9_ASPTE|nr:hypothetical protein ATETN484_0004038000 [Aspergillus terreus]GFF13270.1 peptidase C12, ubiquitin carboxyl-terminal hydrolase 1 [Aspergillus terreus]